jgi:hypothetical protein
LIKKTKSSTKTSKISGKSYTYRTYGVLPIFLDFGRETIYPSKIQRSFIIDDILTLYDVFTNWITNKTLQSQLYEMILNFAKKNKTKLTEVFDEVITLFDNHITSHNV